MVLKLELGAPPQSINVSKHQINIQMYLIISTQGSMFYLDSL